MGKKGKNKEKKRELHFEMYCRLSVLVSIPMVLEDVDQRLVLVDVERLVDPWLELYIGCSLCTGILKVGQVIGPFKCFHLRYYMTWWPLAVIELQLMRSVGHQSRSGDWSH